MLPAIVVAVAACTLMNSSSDFVAAKAIDDLIGDAIADRRIPGAVLVVGHSGQVVFRKAYGNRALEPAVEPMTLDTIFDCASLTKVVATTSCLMRLFEQGKFRMNDHIVDYIPEFQGGKSSVTIRQLLTHFSGLRPDVPLTPAWKGYETGIKLACTFAPEAGPGEKHVYSDINFELLGELVHRLSGQSLADYARVQVFKPLGMAHTCYNPPATWKPKIAPTEPERPGETSLRGVVHDPTARYMGGVAGHAGVFSTGDDLARFCQAMLNLGSLDGHRVFSPLTVQKFTEPQTPLGQPVQRGFGWDIDSPYSSNRGELFPIGSFGHTGFTGTSIWIDPNSNTYVILLTNHLHPSPHGGVISLRSKIATAVAAAVGINAQGARVTGFNEMDSVRREVQVMGNTGTGLEVLAASGFKELLGKRVGLITNQTGLDRTGKRNVDLMVAAGVKVVSLFSPEHGWDGKLDRPDVTDVVDAKTGISVVSLYGEHLKPTPEMLRGIEALVFDIQDVGARFYTYETTMAFALEAASSARVPFYVLDRPNPITGIRVEGPPLEAGHKSFVGYFPGMPVRHGMTMGELATMFNEELKLGAELHVVKLGDWNRGMWFDATSIPWVNPSPNMRSLNAASLYPGLCLLEYAANISVGRGTDAPFEQMGADFIDGVQLAGYLNRRNIPGLRVYATRFKPSESKFSGASIGGVRFVITDRERLDSVRVGLEVACALQHLYPGVVDFGASARLIGRDDVVKRIRAGQQPLEIMDSYHDEAVAFLKMRGKYLLYR